MAPDKATHVGIDGDRLGRIVPVLQRFVDDGVIAGCNTLISRRGEIVHRASTGLRDREAGVAMTNDTIFRIYSMTKPVVSTALLILAVAISSRRSGSEVRSCLCEDGGLLRRRLARAARQADHDPSPAHAHERADL